MADADVLKIRTNQMEGRINSLDGQRHGGITQQSEAQAYGEPSQQPFNYADGHPQAGSQMPQDAQAHQIRYSLTLNLGPMGDSLLKGRAFDDRMCGQAEFQFNGSKGGDAWRGKVERYFISKIPALHMLLQLVEREEGVITDELLAAAVGDG